MPPCARTVELAAAAGVESDVMAWFEAAGIETYVNIALITTEERDVRADLIAPMLAADPRVSSAGTVLGVVRIKKLWIACRELMRNKFHMVMPPSIKSRCNFWTCGDKKRPAANADFDYDGPGTKCTKYFFR